MATPSIYVPPFQSLDEPIQKSSTAQRMFFGALAAVTFLPLVWLGFCMGLFHQDKIRTLAAIAPIINVTSIGHVGSTAFFYVDREFSTLARQNPQRFFLCPILAISLCFVVFSANATAYAL
jgi:hypothetical protein